MVYLTGDTHGDIDRFKHGKLRWLGKRDTVVVLGDFGFVWDDSKEEQKKLDWLRKRPYTLLFLDGSHENYDLLKQYPTEERFGGKVQALGGNVYHVCRGSVLELENKKAREIITGYDDVSVTADPEEPTRCLVDFAFTVAHGLNQIWLSAHITV